MPESFRGAPFIERASRTYFAARETLVRSLLVAVALLLGLVAAETILGVLAVPMGSVLNVYNRTTTAGLDCYPTNPRGYFDLDLRDPATRERFEALRVRR